MPDTPYLSKNERRLFNRCAIEGYAVPAVFRNWGEYFSNRQNYEEEFDDWLRQKIKSRGSKIHIRVDKNHQKAAETMGVVKPKSKEYSSEKYSWDPWGIEEWNGLIDEPVIAFPEGLCGTSHFII